MDQQPLILCLLLLPFVYSHGGFRAVFPQKDGYTLPTGVDPGSPLFLTPYIEKGDIKTARKLSQVGALNGTTVSSFAGFLTVNKTYNSNMFFWMIPAQNGDKDAPFLLWLQGGPGGSSLFGLFVENGPFGVDKNNNLFGRKYAWTNTYHMLYIDNPVGTGFSFTDDDKGYATNEADVGENLYRAMLQILQLFPEYQSNDFYITGESYAGKYIPALAHRIHSDPKPGKINFKGAAIGDGFSDPPVMIHAYADFMFQVGLLDENQAAYFKAQTDQIGGLIGQGKYVEAYQLLNLLLFNDGLDVPSYYANCTGGYDYFNFLRSKSPPEMEYYNSFLALPEVRRAIHVGNLTYHAGDKVEAHLQNDMLQSVKPWLAELMDNYKVLLYTGQLDVIVALPCTEAMLQTVPWSGLDEYKNVSRGIWKLNPFDHEVAGYVRKVGHFFQIMVRGGGHILPYDQPARTYDMIHRFIKTNTFTD